MIPYLYAPMAAGALGVSITFLFTSMFTSLESWAAVLCKFRWQTCSRHLRFLLRPLNITPGVSRRVGGAEH